jgi:hypothetical protein
VKPLHVFIIQPFQTGHADRLKTLIEEACHGFGDRFRAYRADNTKSPAGPRLQDRIDSYIKKANICIADLTGTLNANVLLEVGAAYTLNIPVIAIAEKELPTDIKGNLRINLDPGKIGDQSIAEEFKETLKRRLTEAENEIGKAREPQFISYGFEARRHIDFRSLVSGCERRFNVLTTNLGFLVNYRFTDEHDQSKKHNVLDLLGDELHRKPEDFITKILVLDPDSNFTNDRALGLGRDRREFRENLRQDLEDLVDFAASPKCVRAFQVKTYEALPMQITYTFDDVVVSSVVATDRSSRDCVHYVHSTLPRGVQETYERQFDYLWARGIIAANRTGPGRRSFRKNTPLHLNGGQYKTRVRSHSTESLSVPEPTEPEK